MIDEMYLQKLAQYQSGEYVGVVKEGNLCKGIVAFMVVRLKSITFVVQAIPEVIFNRQWLNEKISYNIVNVIEMGRLCVQGIVTDNYSANINAFSALIKIIL